MPKISAADGTRLYVEEIGAGTPVVFVHEYAGDYRNFEPQLRYLCRQHRCVTYSQRGYPPSEVPEDGAKYSQDIARDDVIALMDVLKIDKAHVVGLSMGGFAALHFGFAHPERARSLVVAGCGYGAAPEQRAQFIAENDATARRFDDPRLKRGISHCLIKNAFVVGGDIATDCLKRPTLIVPANHFPVRVHRSHDPVVCRSNFRIATAQSLFDGIERGLHCLGTEFAHRIALRVVFPHRSELLRYRCDQRRDFFLHKAGRVLKQV
jgi:pimeloyl-ACP methyl ester carboxylesterase